MSLFERAYLRLYGLISGDASLQVDPRAIHTHLTATLSTSILMWAYAITALATIDHPAPGIVGIICSIAHLMSPLFFKGTGNLLFVTMFSLFAGIIHIATFSFFSGGFKSPVLIWFGIAPMLAGIIEGYKSMIISCFCVGTIALGFLYLDLEGFVFPNMISARGMMISQALIVFGFIGLSTFIIFHSVKTTKNYEYRLRKETDKVQGLLQILLHDISNRIQSIGLANFHLKRMDPQRAEQEHSVNIDVNIASLNNVIHSVRKMHLMELDQRKLKLVPVKLAQPVSSAVYLLNDRIKQKKITINLKNLEEDVLCDPYILQDQALANVLSNCVKFSEEGSSIDIYAEEKNPEQVHLFVRDYGIGIPEHILDHLFNPNFPTSRLGTNSEKGSGLGMIIAKTMLEKMGGSLEIASTVEGENRGTLFKIALKKAS